MTTTYSHLSRPGEALDQIVGRVLESIHNYPKGPRTKERRYGTLYGLNDLATVLQAHDELRRRPHLAARRNGAIVDSPSVEFWVDRDGGVDEEVGVLYQFGSDGNSVRFGISYYPDEDEMPKDAIVAREAYWRGRLASPLAQLADSGFSVPGTDAVANLAAEQKWGAGWLAWRRYERVRVPESGALWGDLSVVLAAYDMMLAM